MGSHKIELFVLHTPEFYVFFVNIGPIMVHWRRT